MVTTRALGPCVDCVREGLPLTRKVKRPGPRCATHMRASKNRSSDARWAAHILATYTLTVEEYWAIYEAQGGRCAICRVATGSTRRLSVDHDHSCCKGRTSCGRCVRSLVCRPCNTMLGRMHDDPEFVERILMYLQDPPGKEVLKWFVQ